MVLPLSGCPTLSPIALGTWLFVFGDNGQATAALILLEGGETAIPDPRPPQADTDFESGYVFLWAVDGSTFTLSQYPEMDQNPVPELVATGTVANRRSIINGTLTMGNTPWTASPL